MIILKGFYRESFFEICYFFSDLEWHSSLSQCHIDARSSDWYHNRSQTHRVKHRYDTCDEHEGIEKNWVSKHSEDIVIGKVSKQKIHPHRNGTCGQVVVLAHGVLKRILRIFIELILHPVDVLFGQEPAENHCILSFEDAAASSHVRVNLIINLAI